MVSHPENGSDSPIGSDRDRGRDRASLNGMDWLGNKISRFIRLGLQEQQFG